MIRNPQKTNPLAGKKLEDWRYLGNLALAALIVDEKRAAWILKTYPPEDIGRPGIFHNLQRGEKRRKREETDEQRTVAEDAWRVTHEFDGDEESLPATEEEVLIAD